MWKERRRGPAARFACVAGVLGTQCVANISEYLLPAVPLKRFARLLFHFSFEGGDNRIYRFTPEDLAAIGQLKAEKYACGEWIYDRVALAPA